MRLFLIILLSIVYQAIFSQSASTDLFAEAQELYQQEKFSEAGEVIEQLILQNSGEFNAWLLKGDCHQKKEDLDLAIEAYNKAEKINRKSAVLYTHRGSAYLSSQDYERALKDLDKAIELDPEMAEAHYYRGNLNYFDVKLSAALKDYNKAIELEADYMAAYYMRAATNAEIKKYDHAMRDYEKALSLKPDLYVAQYNMAVIKYINKDYAPALEELNKLDGMILPEMANYYYYRAEAKYFTNDKFGACIDYNEAGKLGDTESAKIYTKYCLQNKEREEVKTKRVIKMAF